MASHFSNEFLEDLRARLPVSAVVSRAHKLRKQGAEFVAVDDPSLSVNDKKGIWRDFGARDTGGDIFDWFVKIDGRTFPEAVAECAALAGVPLPNGQAPPVRRGNGANGAHAASDTAKSDDGPKVEARREIEAVFDYRDEFGELVHQVVRYVFVLADGTHVKTKDGKRKKLHLQRRPDGRGGWIWKMDEVRLVPYRLPELIEAIADDRMVFVVEGEKKAEVLARLGFAATTNAAGAGKWPEHFREHFVGARVVILPDNDDPGRRHADQVAANIVDVATSVMLLELPELPPKGDIVDWLAEGGTGAELAELVATARPWTAPASEPFTSKFGGRPWELIGEAVEAETYNWVVEDVIPADEDILFFGESGSGKSFDAFDLAMCVTRGRKFMGFNVEPGLVVYVAGEAGKGFAKRKRAYVQYHGLDGKQRLPFFLMTKRPDFFASDADVDALIKEINEVKALYDVPLRAIFLDTLSAITPGMNENASQDVTKVKGRIVKLRLGCGGSIILVHHKPKGGSTPRGHGSLTGDYETTIEFQTTDQRDANGRRIHVATVQKQREGKSGFGWRFALELVEVGKNKWGNPDTSCVVVPVDAAQPAKGAAEITPQQRRFMEALFKALDDFGVAPATAGLQLPRSVARVVDYRHVKTLFARAELNDGDDPRDHAVRLRQALSRARKEMFARRFVGADNPYIWWSGRPIEGMVAPVTGAVTERDGGSDSVPDESDIDELFGRS